MVMSRKYISVIGGSQCDEGIATLAEEVGRLVAAGGAVLVCGGGGGVMEHACRGARQAGGVTIGILPGDDRAEGNPFLDYAICTGIGHARNLAVVSSGDAVIAVGGSFGTLSEIGLARIRSRPVFLLSSWDVSRNGNIPEGIIPVSSPAEAVRLALA